MIYPKNFEQKIGFDQIRQLLKAECAGTLGHAFVDKIRFSDKFDNLQKLLVQTNEFKDIVLYEDSFPNQHFNDVSTHLRKTEIEGTCLDEQEFSDLKLSLGTIMACLRFFKQKEEDRYTQLRELTQLVELDKKLLERIEFVIDERGKVRDTASSELQRIRRAIIAEQSTLRRRLDNILKSVKSQGFIDDDVNLTVRSGRMVIPIAAEHKRKIKGFVHDESATGQTVFIEPAEIFDANNNIRELEYEERREVFRILMQLTDFVRPYVPALRKAYTFLGLIDFIRAKARFALEIGGNMPHFTKRQHIQWQNAKHPLLLLSHRKQGRSIQPLNIELAHDKRILVISGPNAGGKSVCLKTVGLVQYMIQCGLLPPMELGSEAGIFEEIFIDIGDEQSLENDLSTYSSHLTNMRQFVKLAGRRSLFLIDEFGTGTEPNFGGAIAQAILEELNKARAFGVVTTHYGNLKDYAQATQGLINGAMRFDVQNLEPLYQLEIGKPGSSFALEIAEKIGLPHTVIEQAKNNVGEKQVNLDKLLRELEIERKVYADRNLQLQIKDRQLTKAVADYTELKNTLDNRRKAELNEARAKARALLQEANQRIESAIREIRESNADKEQTKEVRKSVEIFKESLAPEILVNVPDSKKDTNKNEPIINLIAGAIEEGDYVRVSNTGTVAEVLAVRGKEAEIRMGDLKSVIKINRLERISRKDYRNSLGAPESPQARMQGIDLNEKMMAFSFNLDLRGKRGEEAITEVDNFIDNAIMLGTPELRIVHGKGDGILRNLIRTHLRRYKQVASMQDEHPDRGGAGVTLVTLR